MKNTRKVDVLAAVGLLLAIFGSGADDVRVLVAICGAGILMMVPAAVVHERERLRDARESERYAVPAGLDRKYSSTVRPFNLR